MILESIWRLLGYRDIFLFQAEGALRLSVLARKHLHPSNFFVGICMDILIVRPMERLVRHTISIPGKTFGSALWLC